MAEAPKKGLFYSKAYRCLYCRASFPGWRMYPSALERYERADGFFDILIYENNPVTFTNYLQMEVKVCTSCAYASGDDRHFETERGTGDRYEPGEKERQAVNESARGRRAVASEASDLHGFPRPLPDALVACRLAMQCSAALFTADPRRNGVEAARMGNYALKSAHLSSLAGKPQAVDNWRRAAYEHLLRAFELELKGALRCRTLYQLGALSIYLSEDRTASRCFEVLKEIAETETTRDANRYHERMRKVWQDRDYHRQGAAPPA